MPSTSPWWMCAAALRRPLYYDNLVTIRTRLLNVRESLLHFAYEVIRDDDGVTLAEGETIHIVVDSAFQRIPLPQKYLPSFRKAAGKKLSLIFRIAVLRATPSSPTVAHLRSHAGTSH